MGQSTAFFLGPCEEIPKIQKSWEAGNYGGKPSFLVGALEHDFYDFPYIGNNHPNWLIFFIGVETTNQPSFAFICTILDTRFGIFLSAKIWYKTRIGVRGQPLTTLNLVQNWNVIQPCRTAPNRPTKERNSERSQFLETPTGNFQWVNRIQDTTGF